MQDHQYNNTPLPLVTSAWPCSMPVMHQRIDLAISIIDENFGPLVAVG
jgi:hypothetical protein